VKVEVGLKFEITF